MTYTTGGFNAFFYTLVSSDTRESYFSAKRQQYLVDQGYTFKVVQDLADVADQESTLLHTKEDEMKLLAIVKTFECDQFDAMENTAVARSKRGEVDDDEMGVAVSSSSSTGAKRRVGSMGTLSGADGRVYSEYQSK